MDIDDNLNFSDSDDDLLDITETPIIIRTFKHPELQHLRNQSGNNGALRQNYEKKIHLPQKSHHIKNKIPSKILLTKPITRNPSNSTNDKWTHYGKNRKIRSNSPTNENNLPTMEIIDTRMAISSTKSEIKQNRYQRMREIHNITGFIVNVHDATNYDIDLEIPPELHEKYRDVISNQYTYQDLNDDFLENPNLNQRTQIEPIIGTTYRCRLRGVGISQLSGPAHNWKNNLMCVEVRQLIDRTDGWITCTLSDIDVYQRLLVDIVINTCNGPINLRDYLLSRMKGEENAIFYPYSGRRDRK